MRTVEEIQAHIIQMTKIIDGAREKYQQEHNLMVEATRTRARDEAELAEAQKPKLKHGDICLYQSLGATMPPRIVIGENVYREDGKNMGSASSLCYTPALANIFDIMEKGPILVPMSVEEAEHIKSISWVDSRMRGASRKCKAQLQAYRNATA